MKRISFFGIIKSTLALFSMFFGAGNVLFPFLIGDFSGTYAHFGLSGFLIGGVIAPFIGLIAMMMYGVNYHYFFGRLGQRLGLGLYAFLILILGPVGSIPRLIVISHGTLGPYLPHMTFSVYSLLACGIIYLFVFYRSRALSIIAYVLSPILLASLAVIIIRGLTTAHPPLEVQHSAQESFSLGLEYGYSLLDLVAAFLYAGLALGHLKRGLPSGAEGRKQLIIKTTISTLLASLLLSLVYAGLIYVGAFHSHVIQGIPEQVVGSTSVYLLGSFGGIVSSLAVGLACLTTAIALVLVCSQFIRQDLWKNAPKHLPALITLAISFFISNLGFVGIAQLIGPILNLLHPSLILLCLLNILHKLFHFQPVKIPLLITFLITLAVYLR